MVRSTHSFGKARIFLGSSSGKLHNAHGIWTLYIFCKVGTTNSRVGTGLPGPIRGAAPASKRFGVSLLQEGFIDFII